VRQYTSDNISDDPTIAVFKEVKKNITFLLLFGYREGTDTVNCVS